MFDIVEMPAIVFAAVRSVGPLTGVGAAFQKIGAWAGPAGLFPGARMMGICWDDPVATPDRVRYDAAVSLERPVVLGEGIRIGALPALTWAHARHVGAYDTMSATFAALYREVLASADIVPAFVFSLEIYGHMSENAAENVTDCYFPVVRLPWAKPG